jgi:hypothetical protein
MITYGLIHGEIMRIRRSAGSRRGQAATEYVVVAGVLIATIAILVVFLGAFRENGGRILQLAASEYP